MAVRQARKRQSGGGQGGQDERAVEVSQHVQAESNGQFNLPSESNCEDERSKHERATAPSGTDRAVAAPPPGAHAFGDVFGDVHQ